MFITSVIFGRGDTILQRTDSRVYFVNGNETIDPTKYFLAFSIRSIDKKDIDTSTIEIKSNGEGWLDKDSIPIGNWKFYAIDNLGEKYLFKEGVYQGTSPSMFIYSGDTDELKNIFGNITDSLLMLHIKDIPFVKSGTWTYYHSNGKLWKKVTFCSSKIPIEFEIAEINEGKQLLFPLNDDEPIEGRVEEFNAEGKLFKELYYMGYNKIFRKICYGNTGEKSIIEYKGIPEEISPNNY
jgi:hypothetical protein